MASTARTGAHVGTGARSRATGVYQCLSHRKQGTEFEITNTVADPMAPCPRHGAVTSELVRLA